MVLVSFSYFLFLYIDIRLHVLNVKRALKDREKRQRIFEENLAKLKVIYYYIAYPSDLETINFGFCFFFCSKNLKDQLNLSMNQNHQMSVQLIVIYLSLIYHQ